MSISTSLNNALSGLTASARAAEVVSSNTANVMTAGYARRDLSLSAQSVGGQGAGVRILGVNRIVNEAVLADRRLSDAEAGNARLQTTFFRDIETVLGNPGEPGSLSGRIAAFGSSLIDAASRPDSEGRLSNTLSSAKAVASHLNEISKELAQSRMSADQQIGQQVQQLNDTLAQVDRLNAEILSHRASGRDANALMDQRQTLVDTIGQIVPIRQVQRDHEQIALFTTGGAVLLEGNPAQIEFTPVGIITPDMTLASGALSGLKMNGIDVPPVEPGLLGGGTLGALFQIRDRLAPGAQTQIDALARDLIGRFADPTVDSTLAPGAAGLFTDGGAAFDPFDEIGLAGRISVNDLVDPVQGGQLWRLRDGLGAAAPGSVGNGSLLLGLSNALSRQIVPVSGVFIGAARSASGLASDILSQISGDRQSSESHQAYTVAQQEALTEMTLADGVDVDHELQKLLQIEQAYAANARVIQTVDQMIQQILEL